MEAMRLKTLKAKELTVKGVKAELRILGILKLIVKK